MNAPPPPKLGLPHLFGTERRLMDDTFAAGFARYQEFGLGGSTLLALAAGFDAVVAVDSDPAWVSTVRVDPGVAPSVASGRAAILHADIGPIGAWGAPMDARSAPLWPNYLAVAWMEWTRRGATPDLVYVDGRFRVACCLSAWLVCRHDPAFRLMLHDMGGDRVAHYAPVLDFYEIEVAEGTLVRFRPKPHANAAHAVTTLLTYQFRVT